MVNLVKQLLDCMILILTMKIFERKLMHPVSLRRIGAAGAILVFGNYVAVSFVSDALFLETVNLLLTMIVVFVAVKLSAKKFMLIYVVSVLISGLIEQGVAFLIPYPPYQSFVFRKIATIVVIGMILIISIGSKKAWNLLSILPGQLICIHIILLLSVLLLLGGLYAHIYLEEMDGKKNIIFVALVTEIVVCVTVAFGIQLSVSKKNLEKENEVLQEYSDQQKRYYELLLKKEEDTARFRHDLLNHLQCMQGLLKEKNAEECEKYIADMLEQTEKRGKVYCTGNKVADIILTSSLSKLKKTVEVKVAGRLKNQIPVSDYDLCIVISNLVENAVEAVNAQNIPAPFIHITFTTGRRFARIEVSNSISGEQMASALSLQTRKSDRRLHGWGLRNVRMIVEKYHGKMEHRTKNEEFEISATLHLGHNES